MNETAEGDPVTDLRQPDQRIRRTDNGYVVTLVAFGDHWTRVEVVCEREECGEDDALERALAEIVEAIAGTEDGMRVMGKLFGGEG